MRTGLLATPILFHRLLTAGAEAPAGRHFSRKQPIGLAFPARNPVPNSGIRALRTPPFVPSHHSGHSPPVRGARQSSAGRNGFPRNLLIQQTLAPLSLSACRICVAIEYGWSHVPGNGRHQHPQQDLHAELPVPHVGHSAVRGPWDLCGLPVHPGRTQEESRHPRHAGGPRGRSSPDRRKRRSGLRFRRSRCRNGSQFRERCRNRQPGRSSRRHDSSRRRRAFRTGPLQSCPQQPDSRGRLFHNAFSRVRAAQNRQRFAIPQFCPRGPTGFAGLFR